MKNLFYALLKITQVFWGIVLLGVAFILMIAIMISVIAFLTTLVGYAIGML